MPFSKEIVIETAELLKLSLIEHLQINGYPNFDNVEREFSDLEQLGENVYYVIEKLFYSDDVKYTNRIFLSNKDNTWKIITIEDL